MNIKEKLCGVIGVISRPYVAIPALGVISLGLSFLLELIGLRHKLELGPGGISPLTVTVGALFIFAAALTLVYARGEKFDPKSKRQIALFAIVLLACTLICTASLKNAGAEIKYPLSEEDLAVQNIFVKQFDAFEKGQLHLDLWVDPRLERMENPYDTDERARQRIIYQWDHAYFEGRYYSYFGLAPLFLVYYPYYYITGALPDTILVCAILAIGATIALGLALREFVIFIHAKPPIWLFLFALPAAVFGIGIFGAQSYSDFYYVPVLSAMLSNCLFFFFTLRGSRAESRVAEATLFSGAALAFVFSVMSRPTAALICLTLSPVIFRKFFLDKVSLPRRLARILPFGAIALAGAAFIMWFNYARFGSPLDFGANYQLTVSDVSENTIDLSLLPAALFHYLFQPMTVIERFPFVGPSLIEFDYGRYVYVEKTIGIFCFPAVLGLIVCPFFYRIRERIVSFRTRDNTRALVFAFGAALALFLVFADFCKAGVNMRYLFDMLSIGVLLGTATLLRFAGDAEEGHSSHRSLFALACFVGTLIVGMSIVVENYWDVLFAIY